MSELSFVFLEFAYCDYSSFDNKSMEESVDENVGFFKMPFNEMVRPCLNFEPPIISIVLPFTSRLSWKLRYTAFVHKCTRNL